jgi:hypothetical protein
MSRAPSQTITVPAHEVQTYILNGWRLTDEPHCSGAQMVPPERFLGDDPPPDPPQMRSPPTRQGERDKSQKQADVEHQQTTSHSSFRQAGSAAL